MIADNDNAILNILVVNPLARDRDHLIDDDLFLSECLPPLATTFEIRSSPASIANIKKTLNVRAIPLWEFKGLNRLPRLQMLGKLATLPCTGYADIVFPAFEEISTLFFMLLHPRKRVHLIFHNNISPERMDRHPLLWTLLMKKIALRATSLLVPSKFQADCLKSICPQIDSAKIFFRPLNQMGASRYRPALTARSNIIFFMGSPLSSKPTKPLIELIKKDKDRRYKYILRRMDYLDAETRVFLESQSNVDLASGYLEPDDYYRHLSEASWVLLTHNLLFQGKLSGIFCDAVASGTPIIARDMSPHDEFFERFGNMGVLVDFEDPRWCDGFLTTDFSLQLDTFQRNMAAGRESCSMEAIRNIFHMALKLSIKIKL